MKITKYGHCCLLVEIGEVRILTDPGSYSTIPAELKELTAILITHEHPDHLHIPALKQLTRVNPQVKVLTNTAVSKLLTAESIEHMLIADTDSVDISGVAVTAHEAMHAEIYEEAGKVLNTGFFIGERLFYPGDAFIVPESPFEILALPVAGPWLSLKMAIEYALTIKPKVAFPVHDGILKEAGLSSRLPASVLPQHGIEFKVLAEGESIEL